MPNFEFEKYYDLLLENSENFSHFLVRKKSLLVHKKTKMDRLKKFHWKIGIFNNSQSTRILTNKEELFAPKKNLASSSILTSTRITLTYKLNVYFNFISNFDLKIL